MSNVALSLDEILGKDSLDEDDIEFLLTTQKQRGVFKPAVERFIESNEMYLNLSELFPGKEAASLKNSVNIRIKQDFGNEDLRLLTVGKKTDGSKQAVLLVNMPVYLAAKAAKAEQEDEDNAEV